MSNENSSKTGLFLIELIITIFFFIIASVICTHMFITTHTISTNTINTNNSILWSNNLSEMFLGSGGDFSFVKTQFYQNDATSYTNLSQNTNLLLLFNDKWESVLEPSQSTYIIWVSNYNDQQFTYENIIIANFVDNIFNMIDEKHSVNEDLMIHQLEVKRHIPINIT